MYKRKRVTTPYQNRPFKRVRGAGRYTGTVTRSRAVAVANTRTAGFLGIENKFFDCPRTGVQPAVTWGLLNPSSVCTGSISVPAQGTGEQNRIGRTYNINSVHLRGECYQSSVESAAAPRAQNRVRIVMYLDKQANGAVPTPLDIMESNSLFSFRNLQDSKRFDILMDKMIINKPEIVNEGASNAFANNGVTNTIKFDKVFKTPIKVECKTATTADVANVTSNAIGLIAISGDGLSFVVYNSRIRFSG